MHTQSGEMKAMQITQNNTLNTVSSTKLFSRAALTGNALRGNAPTGNAPTGNAPETIFAIFFTTKHTDESWTAKIYKYVMFYNNIFELLNI
jgi:hypothetical protein